MGRLVLIDSGCSCEARPFPASWKGVPPKHAQLAAVELAVGKVPCYKIDDIIYLAEEELGEVPWVFPWGRYSHTWHLPADLNYTSKGPRVIHIPSGLKFNVVWNGVPPVPPR